MLSGACNRVKGTCTDIREKCKLGEKIPLTFEISINAAEATAAYTSMVALDNKTMLVVYGRRTRPDSFAMRISL
jgi:hypothetical protein